MSKPDIIKKNLVPTIKHQPYERYLPTAFDESLTLLEKVNKVIHSLYEYHNLTNEMLNKWNEVYEWVMNEGLESAVMTKLNVWLEDGTLATIINETIFEELNSDVTNLKTDVTTLKTDVTNLKTDVPILKTDVTNLKTDVSLLIEQLSHLRTNIIYVDSYGAVGDGITDDTQAIQKAFNVSNGGLIYFSPNKKYNVSGSINMRVEKVRGIVGNNARIHLTADVVAINVIGTHDGSANPNMTTKFVMENEMTPFIDNLRFYSDTLIGTAISVKNTFGLHIKDCNIVNMKNGIEYSEINRNGIIESVQIWHMSGYGIGFMEADFHQMNINSCHISYCVYAIRSINSDLFNLQITGNDIECNKTNKINVENLILITGGRLEGLNVVGNNLEDHWASNDYLIKIITTLNTQLHFVGNEIGNSSSGTFWINGGNGVNISSNTDTTSRGNFIGFHLTQDLTNVIIDGNVFTPKVAEEGKLVTDEASFLKVNGKSDGVNTYYVGNMIVSNNSGNILGGYFTRIYNTRIAQLNIVDNVVDVTSFAGFWGDVDFYMIRINQDIEYIRQLKISGNSIRGRNVANGGIGVSSPTESLIIISDNMLRQINGGNSLPVTSSVIIIKDNIQA